MGASEKHSATYHDREYTPDTEEVEDSYTMDQVQTSLRKSTVVAREEFRRWLEAVRTEAKAEAWDEGYEAGQDDLYNRPFGEPTPNPYTDKETPNGS